MDGNCHFIFGAAVGSALGMNLDRFAIYLPNIHSSPETITLFVLGGILGGVFPDIDSPQSYIGKLSYPVSKFIGNMGKIYGRKAQYHRGMMHDPTIYLLALVFSYLYFSPLLGLWFGCLSHVFLDMLNPMGVPCVLTGRTLRIAKIPSGSKRSILLTWISVFSIMLVGIIFMLNPI